MVPIGKLLVVVGLVLIAAGVLLWKVPGMGSIGNLPGDIYIRRGNFSFYFPLATSILVSLALSLMLTLFRR